MNLSLIARYRSSLPFDPCHGLLSIGSDITHFQKFLTCSSYDKPYGLLSGGKIFTDRVTATEATDDDISDGDSNNIYKTEIAIKQPTICSNLC